jgi:hypothetical protein
MKRYVALCVALLSMACGSSSPSAPSGSSNTLSAPGSFTISAQQVFMDRNTVSFTWNSTGSSTYKMLIGSANGGSDVLSADVTGTSYTWTAPRTAGVFYARVAATSGGQTGSASTELPVFTIDMRSMIDAMYFAAGPMSQNSTINPTPFNGIINAAIWADGSNVTVRVSEEAGAQSLAAAQQFVADYLAATGNHITATVTTTSDTYKGVALADLPAFSVVVRVDQVCTGVGVIACANFGPAPVGTNRSFVNLNAVGGSVSVAHEIGHSFGLNHVAVNSSTRQEFRFLMNPALVGQQLTVAEKTVITAARDGGMRAGWTRAQAQASGLVLPYTGGAVTPPAMLLPSVKDVESGMIR